MLAKLSEELKKASELDVKEDVLAILDSVNSSIEKIITKNRTKWIEHEGIYYPIPTGWYPHKYYDIIVGYDQHHDPKTFDFESVYLIQQRDGYKVSKIQKILNLVDSEENDKFIRVEFPGVEYPMLWSYQGGEYAQVIYKLRSSEETFQEYCRPPCKEEGFLGGPGFTETFNEYHKMCRIEEEEEEADTKSKERT